MKKNNLTIETTFTVTAIVLILFTLIFQSSLNDETQMVLFGLSFVFGGFYKAKEGVIKTIENKALNVEFLMIIAALGAFILKNYAEGAILIFIFALSGLLEDYATSKSEKAFTSLLSLAPEEAVLDLNGTEKIVKVSELKINDVVIVKVGSSIPADGTIVFGSTAINESMITGEFVPVDKKVGDMVFSGTLNESALIKVRVTKDMKDSMVQKIIDFVETAHQNKTESESFIEQFERWYVYVVIALSLTMMFLPSAMGWLTQYEAFRRGIVILVVGSPCALVASVSPAVLSSLSNASRKGILIKGGKHLETLSKIDAVLLDKTGTITEGKPLVKEIYCSIDNHEELCKVIYALEKQSTHPLAKAVVTYLENTEEVHIESRETPGKGIEGTYEGHLYQVGRFDVIISDELKKKIDEAHKAGFTTVWVSKDGSLIGYISLMDQIRPRVKEAISSLKTQNIRPILMTGDNRYTAGSIAKEAGINYVLSELLPEDKLKHVESLKKSGSTVMMVGDGINDAPALASADVGVAMGSGTDVSLETADIVFMNNNIENIVKSVYLAKEMKKIALQNIVFSISVITLLLLSNIFGIVILPVGVVFHEGSTILVILNSLRLLVK